jgi:hypothetical protein
VRIPLTGVGVTEKKTEKDPDEIVRILRALRLSILFIQDQRDYSGGLLGKVLGLDRAAAEKLYGLYRDQY